MLGGLNRRKDISAPFIQDFTPCGHRGAPRIFPENTIESFRAAQEILPGCLLETDVRLTKDGHMVMMHDESLESGTDGRGRVREKTLAEIRTCRAGYHVSFDGGMSFPFRAMNCRIPTFEEFLNAFPDVKASVDVKDNDREAAERTVKIIKSMRAEDRVIIGSFHQRVIAFIRKRFPSCRTSFSKVDVIRFLLFEKVGLSVIFRSVGEAMFIPEYLGTEDGGEPRHGRSRAVRLITPRLIRAAHERGIPVVAWTINSREAMVRLMEWGIDGIVTDHIDLLKEVMEIRGMRVPLREPRIIK